MVLVSFPSQHMQQTLLIQCSDKKQVVANTFFFQPRFAWQEKNIPTPLL